MVSDEALGADLFADLLAQVAPPFLAVGELVTSVLDRHAVASRATAAAATATRLGQTGQHVVRYGVTVTVDTEGEGSGA